MKIMGIQKKRGRRAQSLYKEILAGNFQILGKQLYIKFRQHKKASKTHWASLVAYMVKNLPAMREMQVQSLGWEDCNWQKSMTKNFKSSRRKKDSNLQRNSHQADFPAEILQARREWNDRIKISKEKLSAKNTVKQSHPSDVKEKQKSFQMNKSQGS